MKREREREGEREREREINLVLLDVECGGSVVDVIISEEEK